MLEAVFISVKKPELCCPMEFVQFLHHLFRKFMCIFFCPVAYVIIIIIYVCNLVTYFDVQSNLSLRPPGKSDHLKNADILQILNSNVHNAF